jgi:hypothetical protein
MIKKIFMPVILAFVASVQVLAQNTVTTVVTADDANEIAVTNKKQSVLFNLNTIPADNVEYCQLQLTCSADVATAVALKVLSADGAEIANHFMKKGYLRSQLITFDIPRRYISGGRAISLQLQLGTNDPTTVARFFGSSNRLNSNQQYAPRLVIRYDAGEITGTEWASLHADGRHTARSRSEFRGVNPDSFDFKLLNNLGEIKQNLLVYNGRVLVVNGGQVLGLNTSSFKLDTLQSMPAPSSKSTPVVDAYGHFYYAESGQVSVIELNNGNRIKPEKIATGPLANPLTIGTDGRLYVVTDERVSAYSPYPQNKLLWDVRLTGNKSSVVLNYSGQVAYVANEGTVKATLRALDANNGRLLDTAIVNIISADGNLPAPVTDEAGNVYYINKLQAADSLYVLNSGLKQVFATGGSNVSFPTGEIALANQPRCVFFVKNAQLFKYTPTLRQEELIEALGTDPGRITTVLTDKSNNTYILGERGFFYRPDKGRFTRLGNMPADPVYKMVLAADGTLFAASQRNLLAIKPTGFSGEYRIGSSDTDENFNFLTFRAGSLIINEGFKFLNTKVLISTNGIKFNTGVEVLPKASVLIKKRSDGGVSFGAGFKVNQGASFVVVQNY